MSSTPTYVGPLRDLGLTNLEAEVYGDLLTHPSSSGYATARRLGKPTANTYKALESLRAKGAVVCEGERPRTYRAVPPEELLSALERRFVERRRAAAEELKRLSRPEPDGRVYEMGEPEQVIQRVGRMLGRARRVALLDLGEWAAGRLESDLAGAAARGVIVIARLDPPRAIEGVTVIDEGAPGESRQVGSTEWLGVVVDERECVLAELSGDGSRVGQALWSAGPLSARAVHRALAAEWFFRAVARGLERGISVDELEESFAWYASLRGGEP